MEKRHPNHPGELSTEATAAERLRCTDELGARARAIEVLQQARVPFVVGGAYAYATYTGIYRDTKDLDLFPRKRDAARALEVLAHDGWRTERTDEVWLYKAFKGEYFVDLIFSSGNGVATVDDLWFTHARHGKVFGHGCLVAPAEEMVWSKSFVMERERFDGADVLHLIRARHKEINWPRLVSRFGEHWRVLLSHLVLFQYVYPNDPAPQDVIDELLDRAKNEPKGDEGVRLCRGPLLSRAQYLVDVERWNYVDAREVPLGTMTPEEIDVWTKAIEPKS
jgi:hypothetical protein